MNETRERTNIEFLRQRHALTGAGRHAAASFDAFADLEAPTDSSELPAGRSWGELSRLNPRQLLTVWSQGYEIVTEDGVRLATPRPRGIKTQTYGPPAPDTVDPEVRVLGWVERKLGKLSPFLRELFAGNATVEDVEQDAAVRTAFFVAWPDEDRARFRRQIKLPFKSPSQFGLAVLALALAKLEGDLATDPPDHPNAMADWFVKEQIARRRRERESAAYHAGKRSKKPVKAREGG